MSNAENSGWDGYPQDRKAQRLHLLADSITGERFASTWWPGHQKWLLNDREWITPARMAHHTYLGPAHTAADVAVCVVPSPRPPGAQPMSGWDDREALRKAMAAFLSTAGEDNCMFNFGRCLQSACETYGAELTAQHAAEVEQARREEREACAAVAEKRSRFTEEQARDFCDGPRFIAAAIRARGGSDAG